MNYDKQHKIHTIFNEEISNADTSEKLEKLIKGEYLNIQDSEGNLIKPVYKIETEWEEMESYGDDYWSTLLHTFENFNIKWIPFIKVVFFYKYTPTSVSVVYPYLENRVYKLSEYVKGEDFQSVILSQSVILKNNYHLDTLYQVFGKWVIYVYNPNLIL